MGKHIRKDNYTLAALYEFYFFLTLHEGDDIETHIELLNHAATLLNNVGVPNFMDEHYPFAPPHQATTNLLGTMV